MVGIFINRNDDCFYANSGEDLKFFWLEFYEKDIVEGKQLFYEHSVLSVESLFNVMIMASVCLAGIKIGGCY